LRPPLALFQLSECVASIDELLWQPAFDLLFTAQCTLVQSAVLRSHVVCLSVRWWIVALCSQKGDPPTPRGIWGNFGEMWGRYGQAPRYLADHLIMTSLLGFVCVPQTDTSSSYLAVDSTHTAVGRFRSLVQRSGTRCLTSSEIRRVVLTVLSSFLKQSCLVFTNVTSALEIFLNVMR